MVRRLLITITDVTGTDQTVKGTGRNGTSLDTFTVDVEEEIAFSDEIKEAIQELECTADSVTPVKAIKAGTFDEDDDSSYREGLTLHPKWTGS